jgi:hypothetical protein
MIRFNRTDVRLAVRGGAIAGLIAGLTLTVLMTFMSLVRGGDVWYGIKGAAAPLFGERAMQPGFDPLPVVLGFLLHLAVSVGWAIPFAIASARLARVATIVAGGVWGLVVWIGMFHVVLPLVGLPEMAAEAPIGRAIAYHVFFGLAVGLAFASQQRHFPIAAPPRHHPRHAER